MSWNPIRSPHWSLRIPRKPSMPRWLGLTFEALLILAIVAGFGVTLLALGMNQ